jgi:D-alanyl-D-alanine carboxypeptidase (penicillin-binding protein 5/6)
MGGSQVYLAENEVFPVEELLYALMVSSANDAALALAEHVAESRAAFVERMNVRARELGMKNTTFTSPHGLPPANRRLEDGDLTTPRDLALLSAHLLAKTDILRYASARERVFRPGPRQIDMRNHNNLLGKVAGVDGLKTGFTRGAGFCLAATAQREGRRVIAVTMGSPTSQVRDLEIADLFEKAFASLPPVPTIRPEGAEPPPLAAAAAYPAPAKKEPVEPAPPAEVEDAPTVGPASDDGVPAVRFVMPGRKS